MVKNDEPVFGGSEWTETPGADSSEPLDARIKALVSAEPFAVLCTQGGGQPYGSLVAFAFSDKLDTAVFATPVATRKYRLLSENDHVALLIDNRPGHTHDMMEVEAITVTGRAKEVPRGPDFDRLANLLLARHPHFRSFVYAASCALFRVDVVRFFHVSRFQEVRQWAPPA